MDRLVDDVKQALSEVTQEDGEYIARFRFSASLPLFAGHFPGDPVLPGVHQIEMARAALNAAHGISHRILSIKSAKFTRPVRPDEEVVVRITVTESDSALLVKSAAKVGDEAAAAISLTLQPLTASA